MSTMQVIAGNTYDGTTSVLCEFFIFQDFPKISGSIKSISVQVILNENYANTHDFTVYLFKTFSGTINTSSNKDNGHGWYQRISGQYEDLSVYYQYPNETAYHLKSNMIGNILAQKTVTSKSVTGISVHTFSLDLTDYGKTSANWEGEVYLAIVPTTSHALYWGDYTSAFIDIEKNDGIIKYAVGGKFVDCEVYYATGGKFVQVVPYYATDEEFVEICG